MNPDALDMLAVLARAGARFLVVGAHAMALHGIPRATGDLDLWIDPATDNAQRVWNALLDFGAPLVAMDVSRSDLETPDTVIQIGVPPSRIDILTSITGVTFEEAWQSRLVHELDSLRIPFLGRVALIKNKRACARPKDLADLAALEG